MSTLAPLDLSTELDGVCPHCDGQGMRIVEDAAGRRSAVACVCRAAQRLRGAVRRAGIPEHYRNCTLESFDTLYPEPNLALTQARLTAQRLVDGFPLENRGVGLLLTGTAGTGKTHLAIAVLHALIERGANGIFCEYVDLLRRIQNSYNERTSISEFDLLTPLLEAEVLVLDELGATKPTDWVYDTLALIFNKRYNERRLTIITTNFPNLPPAHMNAEPEPIDRFNVDAREAIRKRTLGDRIGERMFSRLQEMCVSVELQGADFRSSVKKARLL